MDEMLLTTPTIRTAKQWMQKELLDKAVDFAMASRIWQTKSKKLHSVQHITAPDADACVKI